MTRSHSAKPRSRPVSLARPLRVGYVPLLDSAPLVIAQEEGFFSQHNLDVRLVRTLGWASVRDKLLYGELDATQSVSGLPFAISAGVGCPRRGCVATMTLNLHGNAITISTRLNLSQPQSWAAKSGGKSVFGVVSKVSSHHFLMREFLQKSGLREGADYEIVVVPPPLMGANLRAGTIDGFCVGEPWNSIAVKNKWGVVVSRSAESHPGHPEKALVFMEQFAEERASETLALTRALVEACAYCDQNPKVIAKIMSRPEYLNIPAPMLESCLTGGSTDKKTMRPLPNSRMIFHAFDANRPTWQKADWILSRMCAHGMLSEDFRRKERITHSVFREDIFEEAVSIALRSKQTPTPILHE